MLNGPWSMLNGPWSMVNVPWSMVNGQWSMVNVPWSMFNAVPEDLRLVDIVGVLCFDRPGVCFGDRF